ncbi:hypothetical protein G4D82_11155 [Flavobacterium sp. CYK-4]|uniref:hypothetical protein n=1 Tax=Flavobacterium lotistagni TaxID=2709660 RepID=UPI00140BF483|nr:hypothetical protein [Flavobacterium lotistagni]NHM07780.1 hypothetical protein [Flavobacterium lotistagni]
MKIITTTLALFFLLSCKESRIFESESIKNNNCFEVLLNLRITQNDQLLLFYKDASIAYFDDAHTVLAKVKGSPAPQSIVFTLPAEVYPNDLRLDISSNKNQSPIVIYGVDLRFQGRTFHIGQDDFGRYFSPNQYIGYNSATATATLSAIEDQYDPFFNTKEIIYKELEKILGQRL